MDFRTSPATPRSRTQGRKPWKYGENDDDNDVDDTKYMVKPRQTTRRMKRHRGLKQQASQQPSTKKMVATETRLLQKPPGIFVNTPRVYLGAEEPRDVRENDFAMTIRSLGKIRNFETYVITHLELTATEHRPSIPLGLYEHNWISELLPDERWETPSSSRRRVTLH
ncbi:hypothetical protein BDB00DRAFT_933163 [Zychaea mexicana]|uniref:uncharacterized protein n=1 Tax=Zychaea mexicana TaxID=64656 RepID=UPI0022FE58E3|nr:uncharacterized protein BDB00DRAFT_933163 [Zychaea mexicana]KAI9485158.1 hypothetical protein BDB00DRAFT_933163 [Zychaea mexicana]